ncbi:PREDICTED: kinesin-like protein KIN-12F [Tarenaya hassleriana]|uniref:kinesin-like protein KIN-12F n=1 Tax=Tarenaya hassleriana TaxID=28532 RepID=UPI00053CA6B3|nr:PREDICTED: kinesin-like protein KIN-12F [Tarenaya hassleriana]
MAENRFAGSLSTSSRWSLLPKSISGKKPSSSLRSSKSEIENSPPADPNIRVSRRRQKQSQFAKESLPESESGNLVASSSSRDEVSKSRGGTTVQKIRDGVEEAPNPHVKVAVRIKPTKEEIWTVRKVSKDSLSVRDRQFSFDSVLDSKFNQEDVFQQIGVPLVRDALSGYNTSVLSYGQTGSGKTYTMWGPASAMLEEPSPRGEQGLAPRIFQMLFSEIQREKEKSGGKEVNYQCRCSFLEIYCGQISDLIDQSQRNLEIKEEKNGIYVENLTEEYVDSYEDVAQILMKGLSSRKVGTTSTNSKSSRSHIIFSFIIESWCKGASSRCFNTTRTSRINLVDLAGADNNKLDDASSHCVQEVKYLKKSLSQLGNIINVLSMREHPGVSDGAPHKVSCLTHLLQESLGGNAKLTVICNISPSNKNINRMMSTLRFGQRVKTVGNKPVINEISEEDVNDLSDQIRLLKEELIRAKSDVCHSDGSKSDYFRARKARESLNQLSVSLNRSLILPKMDNEEEEITVDEEDVKELHQQLKKLHSSFNENLTKLPVVRDSVNSSFVTASCEPELIEDDEICSGETEAEDAELDLEKSLKQREKDAAATSETTEKKTRSQDSVSGNSISINPCRQSLPFQEPTLSESPKIKGMLRKSIALSPQNMKKSMCLAESGHLRSSFSRSNIFPSSTESLAASLQRGLEIIDNHVNPASNRSSVMLSFENLTMTEKGSTSPAKILEEAKSSADRQSLSMVCLSCRQKFENNLNELQDGVNNPKETTDVGTGEGMNGVVEKGQDLENLCLDQAAKIQQLNLLLEQYKHQNETTTLKQACIGDQSSPNGNQLRNWTDIEGHQPEVRKEIYEVKQVQEDSQKTNFDTSEKEALLKEIEDLKNELQSCYTDKLRSSLLSRSLELRERTGFKQMAGKDIENERLRWTEMESEWISLTDELRVDIETQRMRAENAEAKLKLEKLSAEELEDALRRAVVGHARFVEHYTELQEKYDDLAGRHKAMLIWITELKNAMAKAGEKDRGSRYARSLAAELSALRVEKERERDLLKNENVSLKMQLRNTAEAVHAAGELLVRLREAEHSASTVEDKFKSVKEENEKLRKKMEKLKRKHKMEMITMKQCLKESRLPESALQPLYHENSTNLDQHIHM